MGTRGTGHRQRRHRVPAPQHSCPRSSLAGCGDSGGAGSSTSPEPQLSPMTLKVMEFNIEYGGTQVSFAKVVEAVEKAQPDVIGLEEAETNTGPAREGGRLPVLERRDPGDLPLPDPGAAGRQGGLSSTWRCSRARAWRSPTCTCRPTTRAAGDPPRRARREGRRHREARSACRTSRRQLEVLPPLAEQGIPMFLIGDFNAPSWRDYTEEVVGTRDYVKYVVEWPVSKAVEAAGFTDSWRAVYPDPLESLGLTWWAARPRVDGWNPGPELAAGPHRLHLLGRARRRRRPPSSPAKRAARK